MKICIDPGHGGSKGPGAVDGKDGWEDNEVHDNLYTEESEVNLKAALLLDKILDFETVLTRTEDKFVRLKKRAEIANNADADLFISLHANAAAIQRANGIETLYYPTSFPGKKLANSIQQGIIKNTNKKDRGIKPRDNLYVLKHTKMPAVLVEMGFLTNVKEEFLLNQREYLLLICCGIREGIMEYNRKG